MNAQTQVADAVPIKNLPSVVAGGAARALVPQDIEGAWRVAGYLHDAGILPYGINTRSQVMIAIMHGLEIGLPPMQALQSIAVINGKPTVYGDAAIGLVRTSGLLEWIKETIEGDGDAMTARCIVKRKQELEPIVGEFSVADAKLANLWGKRGKNGEPTPWVTYPKRMLKNRARAFALRDAFADVLRGMHVREEVEDYETGEHRGPDNAKVVNDDGPPAPPPEPAKTSSAPVVHADVVDAEIVEDTRPAEVVQQSDEDDGPPDPGATIVQEAKPTDVQEQAALDRLKAKVPTEAEPFLAWVKARLAECDVDTLADAYTDSIEPHVPRELQEDVMGLYRVRERELETAPEPDPKAAMEKRLLAEVEANTNAIQLIKWSTTNFAVIQSLSDEARVRVEAAHARKLKLLKQA